VACAGVAVLLRVVANVTDASYCTIVVSVHAHGFASDGK